MRFADRHRGQNRTLGRSPGKRRVGNEVQRQLHDPLGPHFVDHAVHAGLGAVVALGQRLHGRATAVLLVNTLLVILAQRAGMVRKNRQLGMILIKLL